MGLRDPIISVLFFPNDEGTNFAVINNNNRERERERDYLENKREELSSGSIIYQIWSITTLKGDNP